MELDEKLAMLTMIYGEIKNTNKDESTIYKIETSDNKYGLVDIQNDKVIEPLFNRHQIITKVLNNDTVNEKLNTVHVLVMASLSKNTQNNLIILPQKDVNNRVDKTRKAIIYSESKHTEIYSVEDTAIEVIFDNGIIVIMPGNYNTVFGTCVVYDVTYDSIISHDNVKCLTGQDISSDFRGDVLIFNKDKTEVKVFHHGILMTMLERLSIIYKEVKETDYGYQVKSPSQSRGYTDLNELGMIILRKTI